MPGVSATLVAKGLAAGHGSRALFAGLDLVVAPGDVVGLVGANGAGKSTLLAILAGLTDPEAGSVQVNPPTATVGHLPQEADRRPGETVRDLFARRTGVAAAQVALDRSAQALADGQAGAEEQYALALERWLALGGPDLPERGEAVAAELGLSVDLDHPTTALSGGRRRGPASPPCC
jgi:ATPase subunit of ABC transporter with duplicated ATPase domains